MNNISWQTIGEGDYHLVLLHGWGSHAKVWDCIKPILSPHFMLHLVDLPGYGRSQGFGELSLHEMAHLVLMHAPERAIWLGWSLGGLVASRIALDAPQRVQALVTVASSPCFSAYQDWPGIRTDVLSGFQQQLRKNFQRTVERFLALQTLGTESARQDARQLKDILLALPIPPIEVLNGGLEILKTADLRCELATLRSPFLRLYGALDGLVPCKVAGLLNATWPQSDAIIVRTAAHVLFISHPRVFCNALLTLTARLRVSSINFNTD